jgi:hypothetical protein
MDRDLQDVLRELRMGTAQVGSPEQFFALVAPAAAAIRESLEAVPQATEDLRAAANDVREKAADLQLSSQGLAQGMKLMEDAARAVASSGHQIVAQVARATENMQRSLAHAGAYPQWTLWLLLVVAGAFAWWSRRESNELRRRFDVLEHNQIVIAQRLGIAALGVGGTAPLASPRPGDANVRKRGERRPLDFHDRRSP